MQPLLTYPRGSLSTRQFACLFSLILCLPGGLLSAHALLTTPANTSPVGEQQTITGRITDTETNEGLPGVNILVKNTSVGTVTDVDGNFRLEAPDDADTLLVSSIGYITQDVRIDGRSTINIELVPNLESLSEVVIVGYGTQKKSDLTGSVSALEGEAATVAPTPSLTANLAGKLPGVLAVQTGGQPGFDDANFQIRGRSTTGNNSPLTLVDGIVRPFARVNPHEIESVTVLKDAASTAVYGARAANGVLLITTKRGKVSDQPILQFSTTFSQQSPAIRPELMTASEYVRYFREALTNQGTPDDQLPFGDLLPQAETGTLTSYDWWGETLSNTAPMQQYNISAQGGGERMRYFLSYGYLDQEGFLENASYQQHSLRSNIDVDINEDFTVNLDLAARLEDRLRSADSDDEIYSNALRANPLNPVFVNGLPNTENLPPRSLGFDGFSGNSFGDANLSGSDTRNTDYLQSRISANYHLPWVEGLSVQALYSYDIRAEQQSVFFDPYTTYQLNEATGEYIGLQSSNIRFLDETRGNGTQQTAQLGLHYERTFGRHGLEVLALYEQLETEFSNLGAFRDGFASPAVQQFFAGAVENDENRGFAFETARLGYIGRINYVFDDRYLLQANLRVDQSYAFPESSRTGIFPAFSAGWRISEEPFMDGLSNVVDNLKIRASWGKTGNDRVAPFQFLSGYNFIGGYVLNGVFQQGIAPSVLANPDITWETATTTDIGLEVAFLDSRLSFEADYYFKRTEDILAPRNLSVPATFGAILPDENLGIVDSWGWEFSAAHVNNIGDFSYKIEPNFTIARNEIVFLDEPVDVNPAVSQEGNEIGTRVGLLADGIYQSEEEIGEGPTQFGALAPGDIRYRDINGRDEDGNLTGQPDGQINQDDRTVIGSSDIPNLIFGLNLEADYRGFSFRANFQGASDYTRNIQPIGFLLGVGNNYRVLVDSWSPANTDAQYPRILPSGNANNNQFSDFWLEEVTFVRLRNVQLAYDFAPQISFLQDQWGIEKLEVFFSASNLFTITNLSIGDPEGSDGSILFYPVARVLSVGANFTF